MIAGHDREIGQFRKAWETGRIHHAWLLSGPKGVGKANFASIAALYVLAQAAGPAFESERLQTPPEHRIAKLIEAKSHPDLRVLQRLPREKGEGVARNITVEQVRGLGEFLGLTPALSDWRVVIIDTIDDLEKSAANALLKMLEEPPPNTLFLLVSNAPGRLLPTIRSRCRRLAFEPLADDVMTPLLARLLPGTGDSDRGRLVALAAGSPGRALAYAALDLAPLQSGALSILREGDPDNGKRAALAGELARKAAADRYAAFLEMLPSLVADEARRLDGDRRQLAVEAYDRVRELTAVAPRLSLDPAATIFQLGGILASVGGARLS